MSANLENSALGHGTGKDQFSFQFQRNAMLKNVQTIIQLHSFHMLVLLSLSFLCLPQDKSMNPRRGVGSRKGLYSEQVDWEDGRLVPQNNHLAGVWMPGSFVKYQRNKQWRTKVKRQNRLERLSGELEWKGLHSCKMSPMEWPAYGRNVLISSIQRRAESDYLSMIWTKAL